MQNINRNYYNTLPSRIKSNGDQSEISELKIPI